MDLKTSDENLSLKQERALLGLLDCGEIGEAARRAGVSDAIIWRWLQMEVFQARYRDARRQLVEGALARLQKDCTIAARTLREVCEDAAAPASARVAAARTIIETSVAAIQFVDLAARVEALETLLREQGESKNEFRQAS